MTSTGEPTSGYVFGNQWHQEDERLSLMERGWDDYSVQNLAALGDLTGLRCLEVGAGGGSMARWLAQQVGPSGKVLATDLDVQLLERLPALANLEIRHHNVVSDDLEGGAYDVVHTRLVWSTSPNAPRPCAEWRRRSSPADGWWPKSSTT